MGTMVYNVIPEAIYSSNIWGVKRAGRYSQGMMIVGRSSARGRSSRTNY